MTHLTDEELWDMIDGLESASGKTFQVTHLSVCANCQARRQTLLAMHGQLSRLPLETPSLGFTDNIAAQWAAEAQFQSVTAALNTAALNTAALKKQRRPTAPLVFSALLAALTVVILTLIYQYPAAMPAMPGVAEAMHTGGKALASKSVLNAMLLANALLLLWLFNRWVLAPLFKSRMVPAGH